jgi:hypothetical protein
MVHGVIQAKNGPHQQKSNVDIKKMLTMVYFICPMMILFNIMSLWELQN